MSGLIFLVEETSGGAYEAKALGVEIRAEAATLRELKAEILTAVQRHFVDPRKRPAAVWFHVMARRVQPA